MGWFSTFSTPPPPPVVHAAHVLPSKWSGLSDVLQDIGPIVFGVTVCVILIVYIAAWTDGLSYFFQGDRSRKQLKSILASAGVKLNDGEDAVPSVHRQSLQTVLLWSAAPLVLLFTFGYTSIAWGLLMLALLVVTLPMLIAMVQMAAPTSRSGQNGQQDLTGKTRDLSNVPSEMLANPNFYISVILLVLVSIVMIAMGVLGYHWAGSDGAIVGVASGLLAIIAVASFDVWVSFVYAGLPYQASNTNAQATSISGAF